MPSEVDCALGCGLQMPCAQQTVCFLSLPAEIRNEIYDFAMPSKQRDGRLVVTTPHTDAQMVSAVQPAITRATRQTRSESLAMFYANNEFTAYISRFDFRELLQFVRCITSGPVPRPSIRIYTFMMHNMNCYRGLLDMANAWSLLNYSTIHLEIRSAIWLGKNPTQSRLVKDAVVLAERYSPINGQPSVMVETKLRQKILRGRAWSNREVACVGQCRCAPQRMSPA